MSAGSDVPFRTHPLSGVGVEIEGLDLREPISDATFARLRRTVVDEGLALLRGQRLAPEAQIALGKRFGPIEQLILDAEDDEPSMAVIGNVDADGKVLPADSRHMKLIQINEGWHTDSSFRENPASFSVFSCVVAPDEGGDTFWTSLEKGWRRLPAAEQARLLPLDGVHDYAAAYRARGNEKGGIVGFDSDPVVHPLVREHPESGAPSLYVSEHVARLEQSGRPVEGGDEILRAVLEVVTRPEGVHRHHWSEGDVAIWDNRSMLHRAQGFDDRFPRVMHHVRVAGFEPPIRARAAGRELESRVGA